MHAPDEASENILILYTGRCKITVFSHDMVTAASRVW